jgi:hypothetical protein
MGRVYSTRGRDLQIGKEFCFESLKGKKPHERHRCKEEGNSKMVHREGGVDWVNLAQDREKHCLIGKYSALILLLYVEIKIQSVLNLQL